MAAQLPTAGCSDFMVTHLPEFFHRFSINYTIEGPQLEYFVFDKEKLAKLKEIAKMEKAYLKDIIGDVVSNFIEKYEKEEN